MRAQAERELAELSNPKGSRALSASETAGLAKLSKKLGHGVVGLGAILAAMDEYSDNKEAGHTGFEFWGRTILSTTTRVGTSAGGSGLGGAAGFFVLGPPGAAIGSVSLGAGGDMLGEHFGNLIGDLIF